MWIKEHYDQNTFTGLEFEIFYNVRPKKPKCLSKNTMFNQIKYPIIFEKVKTI